MVVVVAATTRRRHDDDDTTEMMRPSVTEQTSPMGGLFVGGSRCHPHSMVRRHRRLLLTLVALTSSSCPAPTVSPPPHGGTHRPAWGASTSPNLLSDWCCFDSPFVSPSPECFGAQVQHNGRLRFEGDAVSRQNHTFDDAPLGLSRAHDVRRCESGGVLDERGTFERGANGDPDLAFGVGCAA